jgi:hypothetical protein
MSSTRFNPLVPALEEITGTTTETVPDSDGFLVPGENDFSSTTNKPTLRSYISSLTKGKVPDVNVSEYAGPIPDHANAYPLEKDGDGENTFSQYGFEGQSINAMQDYSNSGVFDDSGSGLQGIIKKGRLGHANNGLETLSGHLLLQGVDSREMTIDGDPPGRTAGATAYQRAMPEILNDAGFTSPNHPTTETNPSGVSHTSGRFKVRPLTEGALSTSENDTGQISVEDLSKVAIDILLRATGKNRGADGYGTTGLEAGINTSTIQAGTVRVDVDKLRVGYSDENNTSRVADFNPTTSGENNPFPTDDGAGSSRYSDKSYGVTYNPLEPFESFASGVTTFALLAGGAFAGVLAVGGIFSLATKPNKNIPTAERINANKNTKFFEKGRFKFAPESNAFLDVLNTVGIETDIAKLLNIYVPMNPIGDYGQCVILGFASLIGVSYEDFTITTTSNSDGTTTSKIKMTALDVFKLAGLIALRFAAIVLTSEKGYYTNIFREIMKEAGSLVSNISADPTSLLSANGLSGITNAKIVRFVDTLARIGDAILFQAYAVSKNNTASWSSNYSEFITDISNPNVAKLLKGFAKSRVRNDRLFDRRGGTIGLSDLPSAHLVPESYKSLVSSNKTLGAFTGTAGAGRTNLRLSQKDVQLVESVLDAEYMPFYFHDLRTNEIISFHAFLDELSDSYTANYNPSSGYGRIEEVQTYKDTKRSVGCTFHVVGMNQEDFDYMWWQINKLTTMVYPQWSQGRSINTTFDNGNDFKFTQPFSQIPTATPVIRFRVGDLIRSNYSRFNLKRLFGYKDIEKNQADKIIGVTQYYLERGDYETIGDDIVNIKEDIILGTTKPILNPTSIIRFGTAVTVGTVASINPVAQIIFHEQDIKTRPLSVEMAAGSAAEQFYSPENNSVVKSFESAAGMGLAAVVTSLNFTWMDAQWGVGEDGPGNRAPRSCKVQMAFIPIHDIAPGLDHEGFNRAPIYPVGNLVNAIVEGGEQEPYGLSTTQRSLSK